MVPGPDPAVPAAREALERAHRVRGVGCHLPPGPEPRLVQRVGLQRGVPEIRLGRQGEVDRAAAQGGEDLGVVDVGAGRDVADGIPERQPPGEERPPGRDRRDGEAVPLQDGVVARDARAGDLDARPGRQASGRDGDVVAGRGDARDVVQPIGRCHAALPISGRLLRDAPQGALAPQKATGLLPSAYATTASLRRLAGELLSPLGMACARPPRVAQVPGGSSRAAGTFVPRQSTATGDRRGPSRALD